MSTEKEISVEFPEKATLRFLEEKFGKDNIRSTTFSKILYKNDSGIGIWEIEGDCVIKKGLFKHEDFHFIFQLNHESGKFIGYESSEHDFFKLTR